MLGTLASDPARIDQLVARPETWRSPMGSTTELVQRVALPAPARAATRRRAALLGKTRVPATVAELDVTEQTQQRRLPLKLYQPAHQRFYLVAASLVCAQPGLPERALLSGGADEVSFVLRRLLPLIPNDATSPLREFAFFKDREGPRWRRVGAAGEARDGAAQLAPGEEPLPLFPLAYSDDTQRARTVWAGLVPVGRREEYFGATVDRTSVPSLAAGQRAAVSAPVASAPVKSKQARLTQFKAEVAEPWKNLIRSAFIARDALNAVPPDGLDGQETAADKRRRVFELNLQQQMVSWLVLLDLADYLAAHLSELWDAIDNEGATAASLPPRLKTLYDWFGDAKMPVALQTAMRQPPANTQLKNPAGSMRAALKAVRAASVRSGLERASHLYLAGTHARAEWPSFHFVLAGLDTANATAGPFQQLTLLPTSGATADDADPLTESTPSAAQAAAELVDRLTAAIGRALDAGPEIGAPPPPFALQVRNAIAANVADAGWFVIRCVYSRRDCGPLHPPSVSAPTQRFQLANFFDPDAPARPIRITLPLDTSPAGLRKHNRNTAFIISDMLCGQIQRAKGLGLVDLVLSVLPWPFHKSLDAGSGGPCAAGGTNIGMICSLSIPIITICALILLIIIVTLFDLIFRWLPFFIMCFPVPGLKGKAGS